VSTGWVALAALVIFLLFTALVLPQQATKAAQKTGSADSPDTSFFYAPDDLYRMAEAYGESGRQAYIRARFTFDLAWPLVYTLFLATAMSWALGRAFAPDSRVSYSRFFEEVKQTPLLILDDYGEQASTPWARSKLFQLINHRYNNQKLTIFTSNYMDQGEEEEDTRDDFYKKQDDTLVDRIGIRLRSRIYEMCKLVTMEGKDFRKEVKQAGYRF